MRKFICITFLFALSLLSAGFSVASENLKPTCSVHGSISGGRACAYPFVRVILGDVPDGNIILTGFLKEYHKSIYLFINRDSATGNIFSDAVEIKSIDDQTFKKHPELFTGRMVTVVGVFNRKTRTPDSSFYSTAGSVDVKAINYWSDKPSNH